MRNAGLPDDPGTGAGLMTLGDVLATFTRSDMAPGALSPFWFQWGAVQGTHALFGLVAALGPMRWAVAGFALWTAKELALDIPGAGFAALVVLDSLADLGAALGGFAFGRWRLARP